MEHLGCKFKDWLIFKPGHFYEVNETFVDEQNKVHPVGETWEYLGYNYFTYDDGLTLLVNLQNKKVLIRLELKDGLRKEINDNWSKYVREKPE